MIELIANHFTEVLALIGGSLLPLLFKTVRNIALGKAKTQSQTIKEILSKNVSLSEKIESLQDELSAVRLQYQQQLRSLEIRYYEDNMSLKREIDTLRNQIILFESSSNDLPVPTWLTDDHNVVIWVSRAYEDEILKPAGMETSDLIGKRIVELFEKGGGMSLSALEDYEKNNMKALETGLPVYAIERIFVGQQEKKYFVVKYPRRFGNRIVGISGAAIDLNIINNLKTEQ